MLAPQEKAMIRALIQSPQWGAVQHAADEYIKNVHDSKHSQDTEWETLRRYLVAEGKMEGVKDFIQELFNLASKNE